MPSDLSESWCLQVFVRASTSFQLGPGDRWRFGLDDLPDAGGSLSYAAGSKALSEALSGLPESRRGSRSWENGHFVPLRHSLLLKE